MASIFERFARRLGYVRPTARRAFDAAAGGRLFSDWVTAPLTADAEHRAGLRTIRQRARDLSVNNDYARRFLHLVKANVLGPSGIRLQMRVKDASGQVDKDANAAIEAAWLTWGKKGTVTVCGTMSWLDVERLIAETVARDGEVLVRLVRGFPNAFGFALQIIEADHLDETLNKDLGGGAEIRLGVELNEWRRPVAYHLTTSHPGDDQANRARRHQRVPADDLIHLFTRERVTQSRGWSWFVSAATRAKMIGGYEEAALVAARTGASKMGFYTETTPDAYGAAGEDQDASGNPITDAEPGHFERLPPGVDFKEFDPTYPTNDFDPFIRRSLQGVAAGLNVSYTGLSGDLSNVNYSSIRQGVIDERDAWRMIQGWMIEHLHAEVFKAWLPLAMATGQAGRLPMSKFDKFNAPTWRARGWQWVDPLKDMKANQAGVDLGVRSLTDIAAEQGISLEDLFEQLVAERALAKELGLELGPAPTPQPITVEIDGD
jgi:lambda family phage portal protein